MVSEEVEVDGVRLTQEENDQELLMHMSNLNLEDQEDEEAPDVLTMANPLFQEAARSSKVLNGISLFFKSTYIFINLKFYPFLLLIDESNT